jgi:hypothetical protein
VAPAVLESGLGLDVLEQVERQRAWQQHRVVEFADVVIRGGNWPMGSGATSRIGAISEFF